MGCFIVKEDTNSYKFALESFEEFFGVPKTVMTDQDPALKLAISEKWPFTTHLFCIFHIYRNIQKKIAQLLGKKNEKFLKEFSHIQRIDNVKEFEKEWSNFVASYCDEDTENSKSENGEDDLIQEIQFVKDNRVQFLRKF